MKMANGHAVVPLMLLVSVALGLLGGCASGPSPEEAEQQRQTRRAQVAQEAQEERRKTEEREAALEKERAAEESRIQSLLENKYFVETLTLLIGQYLDWVKSGDVDKADKLLRDGKYGERLLWLSAWENLRVWRDGDMVRFSVRVRQGYWEERLGQVVVDKQYVAPPADKELQSPVNVEGLWLVLWERR